MPRHSMTAFSASIFTLGASAPRFGRAEFCIEDSESVSLTIALAQ